MTGFDTFIIVDWSARSQPSPEKPSRDAIWIGVSINGVSQEPLYMRTRTQAEDWLRDRIETERAAKRRVLIGFDFPFAYPKGFARHITGSDDVFDLWDWLSERIQDCPNGQNNRWDIASEMNALIEWAGPFWGKPDQERYPEIPYRKSGIVFDKFAEKRRCDEVAATSSSAFQLFFNPTVGSQSLLGIPMINRLRQISGVGVWPFGEWQEEQIILAEIWPGLIEAAVKNACEIQSAPIRDREQVRLLSQALASVQPEELERWMQDIPACAREEGWVLGAGHSQELSALADTCEAPLQPPPLRDNCFSLPGGVDWTPVDVALEQLRTGLHAVTQSETVPANQALGRVLAADVIAQRANPATANSAVDGYGFAFSSLGDGDQILPLVLGRAAAGDPYDTAVPPGHAVRILTGAALPAGVDTVILQEDVAQRDNMIAFRAGIRQGANTRPAGEDAQKGATILQSGRRLNAADLALTAATGVSELPVRKPLRVAILSTGDELRDPSDTAEPHHTYDANRPMLTALVQQLGHVALDQGRVPDDREMLREAMDLAASEADVILTSGGASAGDEDHLSAILSDTGSMQQWRIAMKPGRPLALGLWHGTPVFGLPGNPVAAFVCTLIFARPAMAVLSGQDWPSIEGFDLPAAFEKKGKRDRSEYLRARVRNGRVEVYPSEGSGRISGLSWAEGLVELPPNGRHIRPGDIVRYLPFGSFF